MLFSTAPSVTGEANGTANVTVNASNASAGGEGVQTVAAVVPVWLGGGWLPWSQLWARYAVAVPLAMVGFLWRAPSSRLLTWLAERNMGVYVVHILVLQAVDRVSVLHGAPDALRILTVYVGSLMTVAGIAAARRAVSKASGEPSRVQRAGEATGAP